LSLGEKRGFSRFSQGLVQNQPDFETSASNRKIARRQFPCKKTAEDGSFFDPAALIPVFPSLCRSQANSFVLY
jgi:hypothetical protein